MKKNTKILKTRLFLLCALLLLPIAARAETRGAVIYPEGEEVPITETRFDCEGVFSFWYCADVFEADASQSENGRSVLLECAGADGPVYLELMAPDAIGMDAWDYLESNADLDTEYDYGVTETGGFITGFQKAYGEDGSLIAGFYIVEAGDDFAAVYTLCPLDMYETMSAYFSRVLETVSVGVHPVRAAYAEDVELTDGAYDQITVDDEDPPVRVVFLSEQPVTDFRVLALSMADMDSEILFDTEEVYYQPALTPDRPLVVTMVFYGDIPNNGISYVDANGISHVFAVDMSGENGALYLWAF